MLSSPYLEVGDLIDQARRETGLDDFGPEDFLPGFDVLITSLKNHDGISENRLEDAGKYFNRLLKNRLWFAADLKLHPEILQETLFPPVAIVSLPRTGSTKLQRMLGASGGFQNLLFWMMHMFSRIPGLADGGVKSRHEQTVDFEQWLYRVSPNMIKGHPIFTDEPEEEMILHEATFRAPKLAALFDAPDYGLWLSQADMTPTYDYFYQQLQYLQWQFYPGSGKPWLLKAPSNLGMEDQLQRIFGSQIKIIMPHRDPMELIPSIAKVVSYYRVLFGKSLSTEGAQQLGQGMLLMFSHAMNQHMAWRKNNPHIHIMDLSYREVLESSSELTRKIYDYLDVPLTEEILTAAKQWESDGHRNKFQKNDYALAEFGLSEADVRQTFSDYYRQFDEFLR